MWLKKFGKILLLVVNVIAVTALVISYSSVYIPPDRFWIPAFFGLGFVYILCFNVAIIICWLFFHPRYCFISLIPVFLGWGYIGRYFQVAGRKSGNCDLKVISYNVKFFVGDGKKSSKSVADSIIGFINREDADLICLQEVRLKTKSVFNLERVKKDLESVEHYQYARSSDTFGSVTLTRFPIINMGEIRFEGTRNIAIYTDIVVRKDTFRVFNVHLQSYHLDPDKFTIIDSPDFTEEADLMEARKMGSILVKAFRLRSRQARIIHEYIRKSPYPVIVCGDFNDTPVSYTYRKTKGKLKDSFVESGRGVARTYIGKLPSVRIDYILYSSGFRSYNYRQHNLKLSDHIPVSCSLVIR